MPAVVLYFQVHQPYRLRRYGAFETEPTYFDDDANARTLRKVADACYRPATRLLLDLCRRHTGAFRVAFSLSGVVLEQLERWAPDALDLFRELSRTGCCEFLGETSHHSLASVASPREFEEQVAMHSRRVEQLFGAAPRVFRNTELIHSNDIARHVASITGPAGEPCFAGMLCEGVDRLLAGRSPAFLYTPPGRLRGSGGRPFALLLRNHRLSDDVAFRFSARDWKDWPLTPAKFAQWIDRLNPADACNLFMDFETFGEHQWAQTGIFEFLSRLPEAVLAAGDGANSFLTPSQAIDRFQPRAVYDSPEPSSWADTERDLTAWRGNEMQADAMDRLYALEGPIKSRLARAASDRDAAHARTLLDDWRRLTSSDHVYYMATKYAGDASIHQYFSPFDSPYDAYIAFMNALDNLAARANSA